MTAGLAMAWLISSHEEPGRTAFVVGSPALQQELTGIGLQLRDGDAGCHVDVVAVGGHRDFDHEELRIAATAVGNGARFYATGRDDTEWSPTGQLPATGAVLDAVETAAERRAVVAGKPERHVFDISRSLLPSSGRVAIVGEETPTPRSGVRFGGFVLKMSAKMCYPKVAGSGGRTRTYDQAVNSRPLYH